MQDAQDRMQGVVPVKLDEDKDYWINTMESMARDCFGVRGAAARIHLKTELQACISRFKEAIDDGVNLPCVDLQLHTQKLYKIAQPPTPAPVTAPVPAQPLNMQGPFLTPQQVAQLQAMQGTIGARPQGSSTPIQNVNFGPRPPAPTTPTTNLDMSLGDSFLNTWLQQHWMGQPSNSPSPAPPDKPSTSSTTQKQARPS